MFRITAHELDEAVATYEGIAKRTGGLNPALAEIILGMERGEKALFEAWHGRYVDTGETMRSLTEAAAPGALREIHGGEVVFGTAVEQAQYLVLDGRSAVLISAEHAGRYAAEPVADHMMGHA